MLQLPPPVRGMAVARATAGRARAKTAEKRIVSGGRVGGRNVCVKTEVYS